MTKVPTLPPNPSTMSKGSTLRVLLDRPAIEALARNLAIAQPRFKQKAFITAAMDGIGDLEILDRGRHLARVMREFLPPIYDDAIEVTVRSLTPPNTETKDLGLAVFFYLPHVSYIAAYGLDPANNAGRDPFETSMRAQYEITRRFTAEFSMRPFILKWPERTLARLLEWTRDPDPHVRRLCSEGSRPRLPWALRLHNLIKDPSPALPILEALKDDPSLYVRRSVANHIGDIAKDHPDLAFDLCARWAKRAGAERQWLIRHAVRHPAKKGNKTALQLRKLCGA